MRRHKRFIGAILASLVGGLAVFLRVRHLDTTGIWGDQAFLLNTAMRWVNGGPVPLAANKSSIGIMHPPMIEYLYAAALWLWPDILSVAVLTMLAGLAAVAVSAWATYRTFGKTAAFVATALFAVNPWGVFYSQLIWNPTLVPVFSSLTLGCLLFYFSVEQRSAYLVSGLVSAAVMIQLHPSAGVQWVTIAVVCVFFWRKVRLQPLIAGGVLSGLLAVPYLLYQLGTGGSDVRAMLELAGEPAPLSPAAVMVSFDLLRAKGLLASVRHVATFDGLASILLTVSLVYGIWRCVRTWVLRHRRSGEAGESAALLVLLLWFALPILSSLRSSHYLQVHYLVDQLPAHFILIGSAVAGLGRGLERIASRVYERGAPPAVRVIAWTPLLLPILALVSWQSLFNLRFQDHRLHTDHGVAQIRHFRAAIQSSRRLLDEHPACDLVALSTGYSVETSEFAVLREFVSRDQVLLADGRMAVPIPASCAIILDAQGDTPASAWLSRTAELMRGSTLEVLDGRWRFFKLPSGTEREGDEGLEAGWTNGLVLTGYERGDVRPGGTLPLTLTWTIEEPVSDALIHLGTYLLTGDDRVVAQSDGPGFDSIQWRAGDSFITWFDLSVPESMEPSQYRIGVALYTWPDLERIGLTGGGNTAFLEEVEVGAP